MKTIFTTLLLSVTLITNGIAQKISSEAYNNTEILEDLNQEVNLLSNESINIKELRSELEGPTKKNTEQALNLVNQIEVITNLNIRISESKELYITKDFEVNGVKPLDLVKKTKPNSSPKKLKGKNTFFTVQIGVFMQIQDNSYLKPLDEVWYETTGHGTYVYFSGKFNTATEASKYKNKVIALGYPNSYIVELKKKNVSS